MIPITHYIPYVQQCPRILKEYKKQGVKNFKYNRITIRTCDLYRPEIIECFKEIANKLNKLIQISFIIKEGEFTNQQATSRIVKLMSTGRNKLILSRVNVIGNSYSSKDVFLISAWLVKCSKLQEFTLVKQPLIEEKDFAGLCRSFFKSSKFNVLKINNDSASFYPKAVTFKRLKKMLPQITHLSLRSSVLNKKNIGLQSFSLRWLKLRFLDLSRNDLTAESSEFLSFYFNRSEFLEYINLSYNNLCSEGAQKLINIISSKVRNLESLDVGCTQMMKGGTRIDWSDLKTLQKLRNLDVSFNYLGDESLRLLIEALKDIKSLEILNLSGNHITTKIMPILAPTLAEWSQLRSLSIGQNFLDFEKDIPNLVNHLARLKQLTSLEIEESKLKPTDEFLKDRVIGMLGVILGKLKKLKCLNLRHSFGYWNMSHQHVDELITYLKENQNLNYLDIRNTAVEHKSKNQLKNYLKMHPNLVLIIS